MSVKVLICLSIFAFALAEDFIVGEETRKALHECLAKNNLSQEVVHEFAQQDPTTATPEIKDFFLCFTLGIGAFDGNNWDMEKIKGIVASEDKLKQVEECLKKDDKTSEPRERNFAVVTCCMRKDALM